MLRRCRSFRGATRVIESVGTHRLVTVEGSPREIGESLGEQCRDAVHASLEYLKSEIPAGLRDSVERRVAAYEPFVTRYAPHMADELDGLAAGAVINRLDALLLQVRFEMIGYGDPPEGCTSFAVRPGVSGTRIAGQNVDTSPELADLGMVMRVRPLDGPDMLMYVYFPGMLGYLGMNSEGLACLGNAVVCSGWRPGFPRYFLIRRVLEQRTVAQAIEAATAVERASSINLMLTDASGDIRDVELSVDSYAVLIPRNGALVHTNHYIDPDLAGDDQLIGMLPDSAARLVTMADAVEDCLWIGDPVDTAKRLLRNHDGYPTSICRHPVWDGPITLRQQSVASIIADPGRGTLYVSFGNPCENDYQAFTF